MEKSFQGCFLFVPNFWFCDCQSGEPWFTLVCGGEKQHKFDKDGYWLADSNQNEARSTLVSISLLSADQFTFQISEQSHIFWSRIHRERVQNSKVSMLWILWEIGCNLLGQMLDNNTGNCMLTWAEASNVSLSSFLHSSLPNIFFWNHQFCLKPKTLSCYWYI